MFNSWRQYYWCYHFNNSNTLACELTEYQVISGTAQNLPSPHYIHVIIIKCDTEKDTVFLRRELERCLGEIDDDQLCFRRALLNTLVQFDCSVHPQQLPFRTVQGRQINSEEDGSKTHLHQLQLYIISLSLCNYIMVLLSNRYHVHLIVLQIIIIWETLNIIYCTIS